MRWPGPTYRWDWAARNESRYLARAAYRRDMGKFMRCDSESTEGAKERGSGGDRDGGMNERARGDIWIEQESGRDGRGKVD